LYENTKPEIFSFSGNPGGYPLSLTERNIGNDYETYEAVS
jgi:hypothetical protein